MSDLGPKCQETLKEIEAFLDGELNASLNIRIEHHLSDCPPCMDRAEFRRYLKVMISTKCTGDAVPSDLHQRIARLLSDQDTPAS